MIDISGFRFFNTRKTIIVFLSSFYWSLQLMLLDKQRYDIVHGNPLTNWNASEWLIGYHGGFVRRGLFGGLLHHLVEMGVDPYLAITFLPTISYLSLSVVWFSLIIVQACRNRLHPAYFFCALFNPSALYFFVLSGNVYRKDIAFIALFVLGSFLINAIRQRQYFKSDIQRGICAFFFLLIAALILGLHEGFFVFLSLPVWMSIWVYPGYKQRWSPRTASARVVLLVGCLLLLAFFLASIAYKGGEENVISLCQSWSVYFPTQCDRQSLQGLGAISPLMWTLNRQISLSGLTVILSSYFPLTSLSLLVYACSSASIVAVLFGRNFFKLYMYYAAWLVLPASLLFVIGGDWGRYLAVINTSLFLVCSFNCKGSESFEGISSVWPNRTLFRIVHIFSLQSSGSRFPGYPSIGSPRNLIILFSIFMFVGIDYIAYSSFDGILQASVWRSFSERTTWLLQVYFNQPLSKI